MSAFIRPKFAYDPGSGVVDFSPARPATSKLPASVPGLSAVRHDSFTSDGSKQSVHERTDQLIELPFQDVPESDLASWYALMTWALAGNQLTYYPDATDGATSYEVTLEDTTWKPKWKSWKNYSFTMTIRIWVGTAGIEHFS